MSRTILHDLAVKLIETQQLISDARAKLATATTIASVEDKLVERELRFLHTDSTQLLARVEILLEEIRERKDRTR